MSDIIDFRTKLIQKRLSKYKQEQFRIMQKYYSTSNEVPPDEKELFYMES